jgi:hypothetical protein
VLVVVKSSISDVIGVLGGPNVLASLIYVPHSRGWRELQMFVDRFLCYAGPSYDMPIFDRACNKADFVGLNMYLCK